MFYSFFYISLQQHVFLREEWKCDWKDNHTYNCCNDDQWESCFYIVHKLISTGSDYHCICWHSDWCRICAALGSAPIPCAIERQIGTISAVVAVFDMKFVMIQHSRNTTSVRIYGDGFAPNAPITLLAITSPAPVS